MKFKYSKHNRWVWCVQLIILSYLYNLKITFEKPVLSRDILEID